MLDWTAVLPRSGRSLLAGSPDIILWAVSAASTMSERTSIALIRECIDTWRLPLCDPGVEESKLEAGEDALLADYRERVGAQVLRRGAVVPRHAATE